MATPEALYIGSVRTMLHMFEKYYAYQGTQHWKTPLTRHQEYQNVVCQLTALVARNPVRIYRGSTVCDALSYMEQSMRLTEPEIQQLHAAAKIEIVECGNSSND